MSSTFVHSAAILLALCLANCGTKPVVPTRLADGGGSFADGGAVRPAPVDGGSATSDGGALDGGSVGALDGGAPAGGCSPDGGPSTCGLRLGSNGGGTIRSTPPGIDCGVDCRTATARFPNGATVVLTAEGGVGHQFVGWRDDCWGDGPCTLVMNRERQVRATFAASEYQLEIERQGNGVVHDDFGQISCGEMCAATYPAGTTVTLTATVEYPASANFYHDCNGVGTAAVIMNADMLCWAFMGGFYQAVIVALTGDGSGRVVSSAGGIDCGSRCGASFLAGTVLTLTALPDEGSVFRGWSGHCTGDGECTVIVDRSRQVKAEFELSP